jgi:hypothetical protein
MLDISLFTPLNLGLVGVSVGIFLSFILFIRIIWKGRLNDMENILKFLSIILVVSLTLCANNFWIYFISVIIIATGITKLEFLLNLVAIIRGGEGASKYFDTIMKVPYAEDIGISKAGNAQRIKINDKTEIKTTKSEDINESMKILAIEELILRKLEREYNSIIKREVRIDNFVVDGIMTLDSKTDAIIELKVIKEKSPSIKSKLELTICRLIKIAKKYKQQYNRNVVIILVIVTKEEYFKEFEKIVKDYEKDSKDSDIPIWIKPIDISDIL